MCATCILDLSWSRCRVENSYHWSRNLDLFFLGFLFNDGLTEISGNIILSYSRNFPSQAFWVAPFSANKISNCSIFLFPINLCSLWIKCFSIVCEQSCVLLGRISRVEKKPSWGKMIKLLILIYRNQPTWSFTGSYKLLRALYWLNYAA